MQNIQDCYDTIAEAYARAYLDELERKPFDTMLLRSIAGEVADAGPVADFGCGPGHTTGFLHEQGVTEIVGIDLSEEMVRIARSHFPGVRFEQGNMLDLAYPENHFHTALAFYAIVHFTHAELKTALTEVCRTLKSGGHFVFAFHIGDKTMHRTELLGHAVDVTFHFFQVEEVLSLLQGTGFVVADVVERHPYPDVEYPSKRAYIRAIKTSLLR